MKKEFLFEPLLPVDASILVALAAKLPESSRKLRLVPADAASAPVGRVGQSPDSAEAEESGSRPSGSRPSGSRSSETRPSAQVPGAGALASRDDAELVALARAGQSSAFEALYRRHSPYALALAVRVQGNATDVEDILHDSFLKIHDRLGELRDGSSFRAWLSSVVVSLVRTRLRRRRFFGVFGLGGDEGLDLEVLVSPDASPEVRAQLAQIYTTLQSATVEQSICWTLRFIEGRKLEDVAEIARCSLATAKRRIAAVQQLLLTSQVVSGAEASTGGREP